LNIINQSIIYLMRQYTAIGQHYPQVYFKRRYNAGLGCAIYMVWI